MTADNRIRAKVAAIITPTSLVINRGEQHGVRSGMKFAVMYQVGPITDPDNPENRLESLNFRKGIMVVSRLYANMAYCSLEPSRTVPALSITLPNYMQEQLVFPDVENPMFSEIEKKIRVGDLVEQIIEEPKERTSQRKAV
jgi:hypothetical protein